MAHCLLLERIAADVTDRRLSGAAVASGSKLGRPILDRFRIAEDTGVGIRKRGGELS